MAAGLLVDWVFILHSVVQILHVMVVVVVVYGSLLQVVGGPCFLPPRLHAALKQCMVWWCCCYLGLELLDECLATADRILAEPEVRPCVWDGGRAESTARSLWFKPHHTALHFSMFHGQNK